MMEFDFGSEMWSQRMFVRPNVYSAHEWETVLPEN